MDLIPTCTGKTPGERRPELNSITGLRFFAAFFVVLYHYAPALSAALPAAIRNAASAGYTAVGLFFLLSGFVLSYRYLEHGTFRGTARSFWIARLARIYPAYLVGFLLAAPFVIAASFRVNSPSAAAAKLGVNAALALTLLQSWSPWTAWYWNTPGWSLSTEVFFYLCFPVAAVLVCRLGRGQALLAIAMLWLVGLAGPATLVSLMQTAQQPPLPMAQLALEVNPVFRLPEFLIGVLLGRVYLLSRQETGWQGSGWLAGFGLAAIVIVLSVSSLIPRPLLSAGLLAPATALLIYGLACGGGAVGHLLSNRHVVLLGEASYSIYILQWPVAHAFGFASGAASWSSFLCFAGTLIAISVVCLQWVEIPARKAILALGRTAMIAPGSGRKVVVVHRGARDGYQVASAMSDSGMLEKLVTDLYWAPGTALTRWLSRVLPAGVRRQLELRNNPRIVSGQVRLCAGTGLLSLALDKNRRTPFAWRRWATRRADAQLGSAAGRLATKTQSALLSYSYYGYSGFSHLKSAAPPILFQLHPHPASMRRILRAELEAHPQCAASLGKEWELALPEQDYLRLVEETRMARHWLAASGFTKQTLVEHGIPSDRIEVIPYGVDLDRYTPGPAPATSGPLRLLFVGTINQRKGILYLLEALRSFSERDVILTVCGRVVDDLSLFRPFGTQVQVRSSVSHGELVEAYRSSDLFVFPSVAEGFGHVLLESLACGLPVLSTTHTAAPDLVDEGRDGFVIDARRPDLIAERIHWALGHRNRLAAMRPEARRKAGQFSWQRFRDGVTAAVNRCFDREESRVPYQPAAELEVKAAANV